jgi:hypothetical protein
MADGIDLVKARIDGDLGAMHRSSVVASGVRARVAGVPSFARMRTVAVLSGVDRTTSTRLLGTALRTLSTAVEFPGSGDTGTR